MVYRRLEQAGFTLLEMMIASVVLSVLVGGIYMVLTTGVLAYGSGITDADLEQQTGRALDRIVEEISMSGSDVLFPMPNPPLSSSQLTYQTNGGFDAGSINWGGTSRIEFRHASDDPDDGVDNNGNGLVDEGIVVWVKDPGGANERLVVLTHWVREYLEGEKPNGMDDNGNGLVDERGLSFDFVGGVLTVRLTLERKDNTGRVHGRTCEVSVTPRN